MDTAYEIATYLQASGFGTVGTSIFAGQIPTGTDGVYVVRSGGQPHNYTPLTDTVFDIYAKDTSSSDAISLLEDIKNHIHRMHNTSTSNSYIYSLLVIGDVEDVQRDIEYAKIYKITVQAIIRDTSLIS